MTTPKQLPPAPDEPTLTIVHHDTGELNPAGLRDFARAARGGANICRWIAEQLDAISHRSEQMARETDEENDWLPSVNRSEQMARETDEENQDGH